MGQSSRGFGFAAIVLGCALWAGAAAAQGEPSAATDASLAAERRFCEDKLGGSIWSRTELYFGLSRADGPDITDDEFEQFLDDVVTPRFPDGLTLLTGDGQFRGSSGVVVKERSKLLILFYPWSNAANRSIERIRTLYKNEFDQEAVLRVDHSACVSF
jgi:hypothetical protein